MRWSLEGEGGEEDGKEACSKRVSTLAIFPSSPLPQNTFLFSEISPKMVFFNKRRSRSFKSEDLTALLAESKANLHDVGKSDNSC